MTYIENCHNYYKEKTDAPSVMPDGKQLHSKPDKSQQSKG